MKTGQGRRGKEKKGGEVGKIRLKRIPQQEAAPGSNID